jgi:hypothetical protein
VIEITQERKKERYIEGNKIGTRLHTIKTKHLREEREKGERDREKQTERERVSVCMRERERVCVCVCVCPEREKVRPTVGASLNESKLVLCTSVSSIARVNLPDRMIKLIGFNNFGQ